MPWSANQPNAQVLAVHAALMPTGHILYFGGDEHNQQQHETGNIDHTCLFDCETDTVTRIGSPTTDTFCCGHAFCGDGTLLIMGGTGRFNVTEGYHHDHFNGIRDAWLFNPVARQWRRAASMNTGPRRPDALALEKTGGRWYPASVTLANGEVLVMSGHPGTSDARHDNDTPEIYTPSASGGSWRLLAQTFVPYYARCHLIAGGDILFTTSIGDQTKRFDPVLESWKDVCQAPGDRNDQLGSPPGAEPPGRNAVYNGWSGTSVMLPMHHEEDYRQRFLLCGSSQPLILDLGRTHRTDVSPWEVETKWRPTAPRTLPGAPPRFHLNAVLLPTAEVFLCGGIEPGELVMDVKNGTWVFPLPDKNAVLPAEIYNSATHTWRTEAAATVPRNYHSVALLMPDGRVWTAGSNLGGGREGKELRIEIFEPSYIGRADRPRITAVNIPAVELAPTVTTPDAGAIAKVVLIRAGSVTHAFNSDQRYLSVRFERIGEQELKLDLPGHDLMPPGWYLLFLVNGQSVPSKGHFVLILKRESLDDIVDLPYLHVLWGILGDGGGVGITPSGKIKPVPPHSPLRDMLTALFISEIARTMAAPEAIAIQRASLQVIARVADREINKLPGR